MLTSLLASLALSKNQTSKASKLIVGLPHPPFRCYPSLSLWFVFFAFCLFTPFLSVLFMFLRKNLFLLHLMKRYTTSTSESFFKEKTFCKVSFWYQWITQCNTDSYCEHMAGGVNIYLYGCVSLLVPECAVYLWVFVYETHSKVFLVLRYQGSTFTDP